MDYGIQLYSMRDVAAQDLHETLLCAGRIGYAAVEFAGFFGHDAATVRGWLAEAGLRVSGTHTGWQELCADQIDATIAYHKALGNRRIIVPGADLSSAAAVDAFVALANQAAPRLAAEGITMGYHNHSVELLPNADGQIPLQELAARTDIALEIDTFWAWHAGADPLALLRQLAGRVPVIHLKDGMKDGDGRTLGAGEAPVAAVYDTALALGMEMVVESETLRPSGPAEAEACMCWLRGYEGR